MIEYEVLASNVNRRTYYVGRTDTETDKTKTASAEYQATPTAERAAWSKAFAEARRSGIRVRVIGPTGTFEVRPIAGDPR